MNHCHSNKLNVFPFRNKYIYPFSLAVVCTALINVDFPNGIYTQFTV